MTVILISVILIHRKEDNMTEAKRMAAKKYDKTNTRMFAIKLNYNTDADLISMLEATPNIQGFIKKLLNDYLNTITRRDL